MHISNIKGQSETYAHTYAMEIRDKHTERENNKYCDFHQCNS